MGTCPGPPCTPFSAMGNRTGEQHKAYESHLKFYDNIKSQADLIILENVTEYDEKTAAELLGTAWKTKSLCLDPRLFGCPTARARIFIAAWRPAMLTWNKSFDFAEVISAMKARPVMSIEKYFWKTLPKENLSGWHVACLQVKTSYRSLSTHLSLRCHLSPALSFCGASVPTRLTT